MANYRLITCYEYLHGCENRFFNHIKQTHTDVELSRKQLVTVWGQTSVQPHSNHSNITIQHVIMNHDQKSPHSTHSTRGSVKCSIYIAKINQIVSSGTSWKGKHNLIDKLAKINKKKKKTKHFCHIIFHGNSYVVRKAVKMLSKPA